MTQVLLGTPGLRASRSDVDRRAADHLTDRLRGTVRGDVRFDTASRALYATDASNYRQVPIGVVLPRDADDVLATLAACREVGAPVLARGGGTSLAGQGCNVAVVLDFSRYMHRILALDPEARTAVVQPGVVLDRLRDAAEEHHLTFGPDPATHASCTLGGMIGNNSCGVHALLAGKTVENVLSLDVVLYDGTRMTVGPCDDVDAVVAAGGRRGEIYAGLRALRDEYGELVRERYPDIPRRVSGYNLDELLPERGFHVARALVGTESTCAIVLEATVQLVASPRARKLVVLGYRDIFAAGDGVGDILAHGPMGLEAIDDRLVADMTKMKLHPDEVAMLPEGKGWALVEFGADTPGEAEARARACADDLASRPDGPSVRLFDTSAEERRIWQVRESALAATAAVPGQPHQLEGWEDSAVEPLQVGAYLRELRALLDRYSYTGAFYGHLGHGCIHTRNSFDLTTAEGIAKYRSYVEEAADLCLKYHGSVSGEHGDGQSRAELYPKMFGPELVEAFRRFKALWDPDGKMNPGKLVDPFPITSNLKMATVAPVELGETAFRYPEDGGELVDGVLRCVGVGRCRRTDTGTMCPSYMVTGEEMHSTRGRARLLFEMLAGEVVTDGWRSPEVREALDLCISCKGCKGDCPVSVDMATYKAEFLHHHYAGRVRPRSAYAFGLITWAARVASLTPRTVNAVAAAPGLAAVVKRLGGVAQDRAVPRFAGETFRSWFARRPPSTGDESVVLWPDTFSNHFSPGVAQSAVAVLEDAGLSVRLPRRILCCGRPLYDFGMLDAARRLLRQTLDVLRDDLAAGRRVVVLEPSCLSVFRDELVSFYPDDPDARRLADQACSLAELLVERGYTPPAVGGQAIVQGHCHQKALRGMDADLSLLAAAGVDARLLDSGCCGMAGPFGFEAEHYEHSVAMAGRVLLPEVRRAGPGTRVVADGFSCATQVRQSGGRDAVHLAEVLASGLRDRPGRTPDPPSRRAAVREAAVLAGAAGVAALGLRAARRIR